MPDLSLRRLTIVVREGESLPDPTVDFFLCRAVVQVAATEDEEYVCLRTAAGGYAWIETTAGAPLDATYLTQTPNGTLTAEQALSALATGLIQSTTATGVVQTRSVAVSSSHGGIAVANGDGAAGNPTLSLAAILESLKLLDNAGTHGFVAYPSAGTVVERQLTAGSTKIAITNGNGVLGDPTIDVGTLAESDVTGLVADLAAKAPVGAKYITQVADATLTNEQALGALATGILKNTTATGVLGIAVGSDLPSHTHAEADTTNLTTDLAAKANKTDNLSVFAATTSAQLAGVLSDETGSGKAVFGTGPSLSDPTLTNHLLTGTTAPTISAGTAAGTTGAATGSAGTDVAGIIQIVPGGTGIAAGTIATITFGAAMPSANFAVLLTPASSAARTLGGVVGPTGRTTGKVDIDTRTALTSGSTYQWVYFVVSYG